MAHCLGRKRKFSPGLVVPTKKQKKESQGSWLLPSQTLKPIKDDKILKYIEKHSITDQALIEGLFDLAYLGWSKPDPPEEQDAVPGTSQRNNTLM